MIFPRSYSCCSTSAAAKVADRSGVQRIQVVPLVVAIDRKAHPPAVHLDHAHSRATNFERGVSLSAMAEEFSKNRPVAPSAGAIRRENLKSVCSQNLLEIAARLLRLGGQGALPPEGGSKLRAEVG